MVCISYGLCVTIEVLTILRVPSLPVSLFMASCQRRKVFFQLKIGRALRLPDFLLELYSIYILYILYIYSIYLILSGVTNHLETAFKWKRSHGIFLRKKLECIIKSPLLECIIKKTGFQFYH